MTTHHRHNFSKVHRLIAVKLDAISIRAFHVLIADTFNMIDKSKKHFDNLTRLRSKQLIIFSDIWIVRLNKTKQKNNENRFTTLPCSLEWNNDLKDKMSTGLFDLNAWIVEGELMLSVLQKGVAEGRDKKVAFGGGRRMPMNTLRGGTRWRLETRNH